MSRAVLRCHEERGEALAGGNVDVGAAPQEVLHQRHVVACSRQHEGRPAAALRVHVSTCVQQLVSELLLPRRRRQVERRRGALAATAAPGRVGAGGEQRLCGGPVVFLERQY